MKTSASSRGISIASTSRPLKPDDLKRFQYIVAMDGSNKRAIETAVEYWEASMDGCHVVMMGRFCKQSRRVDAIPDPWSGGQQGFEKVLDLLEDACVGLLEELAKTHDLV
mmetsp:Transcript_9346/g.23988  ORF Transcript_9346/g.23988 Transcript_9346/m.23988 type:complete len:110 (+) Transcript_9346:228-557(+)